MHASPNVLMALVVILSVLLAVAIMVLGVLWSRAREVPAQAAHPVDEMAQRQRELEALLARIGANEAGRADSGGLGTRHAASRAPMWTTPGRRMDQTESGTPGGPTLIAVPNLAAPPAKVSASASAAFGRRFGPIWDLFDAGATTEEIARRTGQPIGQVELILALRRQLTAAASGARV